MPTRSACFSSVSLLAQIFASLHLLSLFNFRAFITDPEGENSYPIVTYTWLLVNKENPDKNKAIALEAMIEYGLTKGQQESAALGYVPLPKDVVTKVAAEADKISPDYQIKVE